MGGFQAVASGLGEAGEQEGQGLNQALNQALKVQLQNHNISMDQSNLALRQLQAKQSYDVAQQSHDLTRQQMLENGWTHTGTVKGADGQYYQQFDNPRMPPGQQTRTIPYSGGGVPPDSFEAHLAQRQQLINQGVDKDKAAEIAFKVAGLYRTDPAGLVKEYQQLAKDMNEDNDISTVPVFGFGKIDISTPEGQAKYAQAMIDSGRGMAPLLRGMMGLGGKPTDMTGWTANEQREYKALESEVNRKTQNVEKMMGIYGQATFMPGSSLNDLKDVTKQMDDLQTPLFKQLEDKAEEINARHGRAVSNTVSVIAPDGRRGTIPKGDLAKALAQGYKQVTP